MIKIIEKATKKIEILEKINGQTMLSAVMNLHGWQLVLKDRSQNTSLIIHEDNEDKLLELKRLLGKPPIFIAIQVP